MVRPVRGCLTAWLQQEGAEDPQTKPSVPWQEEQPEATEGKVIADYDLDVDYESEGSDPEIKPVDEEDENSDTEYVKMEH